MNGIFVPVPDTIFSWPVLAICLMILLTLPFINRLMMPEPDQIIEISPEQLGAVEAVAIKGDTPAERIEYSRVPTLALGFASIGRCEARTQGYYGILHRYVYLVWVSV